MKMTQRSLSVRSADAIAQELLQEMLHATRNFIFSFVTIVKRDCRKRKVRYEGIISWKESCAWRRQRLRELVGLARKHNLCKDCIKKVIRRLKTEVIAEVVER